MNKYIIKYNIPLRFNYNNVWYKLIFDEMAPDGYCKISYFNHLKPNMENDIFRSDKNNLEQCLTEFLYWFELNKYRCKSIQYFR